MNTHKTTLEQPMQQALNRILKVIYSRVGRVSVYSTAILGIVALIPGIELPIPLAAIATSIGVEAIGIIMGRIASGENVSDDEIANTVTIAIAQSNIDSLLTKDDFFSAFTNLFSRLEIQNKQQGEILGILQAEIPYLKNEFRSLTVRVGNQLGQLGMTELSSYPMIISGADVSEEAAKEYVTNAVQYRWPLLYLFDSYKSEIQDLLTVLLIEDGFQAWKECLYLLICTREGSPINISKEYESMLKRVGRSPWEVCDTILSGIGASLQLTKGDILTHLYKMDYLEFLPILGEFINSQEALCHVLNGSHHQNLYIKRAAAKELKNFHFWASVDRLLELLDEADIGVQAEALRSLGSLATRGVYDEWIVSFVLDSYSSGNIRCESGPPYSDNQYDSIFPVGINSRSNYLKTIAKKDFLGREGTTGLLGLIGKETELDLLIQEYSSFVAFNRGDRYHEYVHALNLIDERLHGEFIYSPIVDKLPLTNRWWRPVGFMDGYNIKKARNHFKSMH